MLNMAQKLNIVVVGTGGREHALCDALLRSASTKKVWCISGNAGISELVECVDAMTVSDVERFCKEQHVDLVVIGPEQPLVDGWADVLRAAGIRVFGPSAAAAQLEGSKGFTKDILAKYKIPTGSYQRFTQAKPAKAYLQTQSIPVVIKADGLAAGKGVVIAMSREEAEETVDEMFAGKFGDASREIVIEEFLDGEEVSFFALCDGETAVEFGSAQDHKRVGDGDTGLNTGGMGTYTPAPVVTDSIRDTIMRDIILPTVHAMKSEGMPFQGVLFCGLMIGAKGPQVIEYNVRFGDPEAQVLLARLDDDLADILYRAAGGELPKRPLKFRPEAAVCVVMASNGYPEDYIKGSVIRGVEKANSLPNVTVYHAGTALQNGALVAVGGRVLGVTALGADVKAAQEQAYKAVDAIDWSEGFCRRDIAWRAFNRVA
jgi:phosphoribosylamine--glycine ligase